MTTAVEMKDQLRRHFLPQDNYDEFGDAGQLFTTELTAPNSTRRADVIHAALWGSRGNGIDVVEIKVSLSDFKAEIKQPAKAEAWWPYCNRFWIAAPSIDVAPPELLPEGWGLMVPTSKRRFKVVVKPAERDNPIVDFDLMARLITRVRETSMGSWRELKADIARQVAAGVDEGRRQITEQQPVLTMEQRHRLSALDRFEDMAGVRLSVFDRFIDGQVEARTAGAAFRRMYLDQRRDDEARRNLDALSDRMVDEAEAVLTAAKALRKSVRRQKEASHD